MRGDSLSWGPGKRISSIFRHTAQLLSRFAVVFECGPLTLPKEVALRATGWRPEPQASNMVCLVHESQRTKNNEARTTKKRIDASLQRPRRDRNRHWDAPFPRFRYEECVGHWARCSWRTGSGGLLSYR